MRKFGIHLVGLVVLAWSSHPPLALIAAGSGLGATPSLKVARQGPFLFVRADGMVYVVGGSDLQANTVLDSELYSLAAGSVLLPLRSAIPPTAVEGGDGTTEETAALLTGGRVLDCKYENCELYDPALGNWTNLTLAGNLTPFVTLADGWLLRAGGEDRPLHSNGQSFVIDPQTLIAMRVGDMTFPADGSTFVRLLDGRVFAAGGLDFPFVVVLPVLPILLNQAQIYDPKTQTWSQVSPMNYHLGPTDAILLADGRVLVGGAGITMNNPNQNAEIYDPTEDRWTLVDGVQWLLGTRATMLPDGEVLLAGGETVPQPSSVYGNPTNRTLIWNPVTGSVRQGRPMTIPRAIHGVVVLPDGTTLAMGGITTGPAVTASVEVLSYGQPQANLTLNPDFYIASATESSANDDGFWGLQATVPGNLAGGMYFGGLLAAQGSQVAFGAFAITQSQTVTVHADLFALPGSTGDVDLTLRLLDINKNPVAPGASGTGSVTWTGQLATGFYVAELRSGANSPAAAFNASVSAAQLQGGGSAGGLLQWSAGVTGYLAFGVSDQEAATFQVLNEQSYGIGTGAGSVVLTVKDGAGNVLKKLAPGGIDLTSNP